MGYTTDFLGHVDYPSLPYEEEIDRWAERSRMRKRRVAESA